MLLQNGQLQRLPGDFRPQTQLAAHWLANSGCQTFRVEANYEVDRRAVGPVRCYRCFDPSGRLPTSLESGKKKREVSRLWKPNGLAGCI